MKNIKIYEVLLQYNETRVLLKKKKEKKSTELFLLLVCARIKILYKRIKK